MLAALKSAVKAVADNVAQATQPPVQVGARSLQIKEQLGEGGFAYVYSVEDTATGQAFALKRMLCQDRETRDIAEKEINMLRLLKGHPHILNYIDSCKRENTQGSQRATEYFILMELCTGGSLIDLIQRRQGQKLGELQLCELFRQIVSGVQHMHAQNPPVAHRDLKIENILIHSSGALRLCDFGSCSTARRKYESGADIAAEEERIGKYSTAMYRAPELADMWSFRHRQVDEKVDVWALGQRISTRRSS